MICKIEHIWDEEDDEAWDSHMEEQDNLITGTEIMEMVRRVENNEEYKIVQTEELNMLNDEEEVYPMPSIGRGTIQTPPQEQ